MRPFRPLSLGRFALVTLASALAFSVAAVALPHDPYIRYQALSGTIFERARWFYERIHFDATPIDAIFIGSSRTARGVVTPDLEAALAARGVEAHLVNFSLPASGFDIRYVLAREALEAREVRLLVISLVEQFPREGHQAFGDIATPGEVLTAPWMLNTGLPANVLRLPARQIGLAAASWAPDGFGYDAGFDPAGYPGPSVDHRAFNPGQTEGPKTAADIAALEAESRFRRGDLTRPLLPAALADIEFGVPRGYIRRIAALAEAHGVKLAFLYLPFYGGFDHPLEKAWLEQYGPVLEATFLKDDPMNYNDVAHVSQRGADRITAWLAGELVPLMREAGS